MNNEISDSYDEEQLKKLQGFNLAVYQSRHALFISSGIVLIGEIISYTLFDQMPYTFNLLPFTLMFITFIGLALWTQKKPYTALLIGAIAYSIYILVNTIPFIYKDGFQGFFKGIYVGCLYKILIITLIARATPKAKSMQKINETIEK